MYSANEELHFKTEIKVFYFHVEYLLATVHHINVMIMDNVNALCKQEAFATLSLRLEAPFDQITWYGIGGIKRGWSTKLLTSLEDSYFLFERFLAVRSRTSSYCASTN